MRAVIEIESRFLFVTFFAKKKCHMVVKTSQNFHHCSLLFQIQNQAMSAAKSMPLAHPNHTNHNVVVGSGQPHNQQHQQVNFSASGPIHIPTDISEISTINSRPMSEDSSLFWDESEIQRQIQMNKQALNGQSEVRRRQNKSSVSIEKDLVA